MYGSHPFLWYFYAAIPHFLLGQIPFFLIGLLYYVKSNIHQSSSSKSIMADDHYVLLICLIWNTLAFSFISHKEDRFILATLPILLIFSMLGIMYMFQNKVLKRFAHAVVIFAIISNLAYFGFSAFYRNRASLPVMDYLRNQNDNVKGVLFFTECH